MRTLADGTHAHGQQLHAARLHHEPPAHGVEGVGGDAGQGGDRLRHGPLGEEAGAALVVKQHALGGVVQAKVDAAVHDDALRCRPRHPGRKLTGRGWPSADAFV